MKKVLDIRSAEKLNENTLREYSETQLLIQEFDTTSRPQEIEGRYPLRLKDSLLIVVLSGEIYIDMNYQSHTLVKNMVVQLSEEDILLNISHSNDFTGYLVSISSDLRSEIKGMSVGVRMQKASRLKRAYPIQELDDKDLERIIGRIRNMQSYLSDKTHLNRSLIIRHEIINLFLDLDNCRTQKHGEGEVELSHAELLRERFREILVKDCRQHRVVGYYANELSVTPDYLSRIIREYDGQSAIKWIINAVLTEAKIQLRQPYKTINQIALALNFPDQSTFGKFFKRHMGISPVDFRKGPSA